MPFGQDWEHYLSFGWLASNPLWSTLGSTMALASCLCLGHTEILAWMELKLLRYENLEEWEDSVNSISFTTT